MTSLARVEGIAWEGDEGKCKGFCISVLEHGGKFAWLINHEVTYADSPTQEEIASSDFTFDDKELCRSACALAFDKLRGVERVDLSALDGAGEFLREVEKIVFRYENILRNNNLVDDDIMDIRARIYDLAAALDALLTGEAGKESSDE